MTTSRTSSGAAAIVAVVTRVTVTVAPLTLLGAAALLVGCELMGPGPSAPSTELFDHPWPDERLRGADGQLDLGSFPEGTGAPIRWQSEAVLADADGWGTTSPIFFPQAAPLDAGGLPTPIESMRAEASAWLMNVDPDSAEVGRRHPVDVRFLEDAGPFGGTDLLVMLPMPGLPLLPHTLYAAVLTTGARRADGSALPREPPPPPMSEHARQAHRVAAEVLRERGVSPESVAARAVFRSGDPTAGLVHALAHAEREAPPRLLSAPRLTEEHETYCVYASETEMPVYQGGEPPYLTSGGGWARDASGRLVLQRRERSRVWITVPRQPEDAPPTTVFMRIGGGGDRPLVDRGPRDADGDSTPGSGLAVSLAAAGHVGVSVDGPLGGSRNTAGWDEQVILFNVVNPAALRDNVRQSALELALLPSLIDGLTIDTSGCAGAAREVTLSGDDLTLFGHSNGATIAPLAVAVQQRYARLVMSGAGASWIRQVVHKESPTQIRPFVDRIVGYGLARVLVEHDPMLGFLAWAGEPAEPTAYAHLIAARTRPLSVLVFQGVMDTYIPPPIANPVALALGLELGGDALDANGVRPLEDDLALASRGRFALPLSGNGPGGTTRVVTQHAEDGIEDGHEVLFQTPAARRQLRCFLASAAFGAPVLVAPGPEAAGCDEH